MQDRQRLFGPRLARHGSAIKGRPPGQHRVRTQRQGLDDIAAAPDAAIEDHRGAVAHGGDHLGQDVHGWRGRIQRPPAVIGHHHGVGAVLDGEHRVFLTQDALDDQLAGPEIAHAVDILPGHGDMPHGPLGAGAPGDAVGIFLGVVFVARHARGGEITEHHADQPFGVQGHVGQRAGRYGEGNGEAVAAVVFPVVAERPVDGHHQGLETGVPRPAHHFIGQLLFLPHVELKPQPPAGLLGDLFHGGDGPGGQGKGHALGRSRLGELQFALIPGQPGDARGRDGQRQLGAAAQKLGAHVALGQVDQEPGAQFQALEGLAVVGQGDLVLGAAVEIFEHALGQAPARDLPHIRDVEAAIQSRHRFPP